MSKADPIFSKNDTPGSNLPPELQGKSAEEVAAYFQRREQILQDRLRAPKPPAPEKKDTKFDMFGDPEGSVRRVVTNEVTEQVQRVTKVATPALVNACKITVRDAHPDYLRFAAEIEKRMSGMTPDAQCNPDYWEMTYKMVRGEQADKLMEEARAAERAAMNPVERPTPKGSEAPKPRDLTEEELKIARKFGMTKEEYREAADRYDQTDGRLPLTLDNARPRFSKKKVTA